MTAGKTWRSSYIPNSSVTILLGNGDGTFRTGAAYTVASQLFSVATADFRNNGILDLVVGDDLDSDIYVLLGNCDGTFQPASAYPVVGPSESVSTGQFMNSGKTDIVAITQSSLTRISISVLPGNGDGTFGAPVTMPIPYNIGGAGLASGYFNAGAPRSCCRWVIRQQSPSGHSPWQWRWELSGRWFL